MSSPSLETATSVRIPWEDEVRALADEQEHQENGNQDIMSSRGAETQRECGLSVLFSDSIQIVMRFHVHMNIVSVSSTILTQYRHLLKG